MARKAVRALFYLALLLTPIFGFQELLKAVAVLSGSVNAEAEVVIKATKDLILVLIFLFFLIDISSGARFLHNLLVWAMLTIIIVSFFVTCLSVGPLIALIGLRAFSPFLFIFIAYKYFDMNTVKCMVRILSFIVIVQFCAASVQMSYGLPLDGFTYFGLAARPFGTFVNPWSFAVFVCFVLCFRLGFDIYSCRAISKATSIFMLASILFIFLAASGAGLLTLSVILLTYFLSFSKIHTYIKASLFPTLLLIPPLILSKLRFLTGREHIFRSIQSRIDIFMNLVCSSSLKDILIGKGLGIGSNAAVTFLKLNPLELTAREVLFISDSLFTSVMAQAGVLFLLLFMVFNIYLFAKAISSRYQGIHPIALLAIPSAMVASLANNIIELFPVNWVLFAIYGLVLKEQKRDFARNGSGCPTAGRNAQRPPEHGHERGLSRHIRLSTLARDQS